MTIKNWELKNNFKMPIKGDYAKLYKNKINGKEIDFIKYVGHNKSFIDTPWIHEGSMIKPVKNNYSIIVLPKGVHNEPLEEMRWFSNYKDAIKYLRIVKEKYNKPDKVWMESIEFHRTHPEY